MKQTLRSTVHSNIINTIHQTPLKYIASFLTEHIHSICIADVRFDLRKTIDDVMWPNVAEPVYNNINEWIASYQQQ